MTKSVVLKTTLWRQQLWHHTDNLRHDSEAWFVGVGLLQNPLVSKRQQCSSQSTHDLSELPTWQISRTNTHQTDHEPQTQSTQSTAERRIGHWRQQLSFAFLLCQVSLKLNGHSQTLCLFSNLFETNPSHMTVCSADNGAGRPFGLAHGCCCSPEGPRRTGP